MSGEEDPLIELAWGFLGGILFMEER